MHLQITEKVKRVEVSIADTERDQKKAITVFLPLEWCQTVKTACADMQSNNFNIASLVATAKAMTPAREERRKRMIAIKFRVEILPQLIAGTLLGNTMINVRCTVPKSEQYSIDQFTAELINHVYEMLPGILITKGETVNKPEDQKQEFFLIIHLTGILR